MKVSQSDTYLAEMGCAGEVLTSSSFSTVPS
jgi:hypothetical protein